MRKVLGILTEDFRLYHDLVAAMKARDLPFTSLSFARRVPDAVGAILTSPAEASAFHVRQAVRTFPAKDIRVRVGLGDPTNRDRILKALARDALRVEVVDEAGTTHRTAQPDVDAAIDIAKSSGRRVEAPVEIRPTPGEVREIQRRSRLDSGGVVTISSELAGAVARGDLTLEEAIAPARRQEGQSQG